METLLNLYNEIIGFLGISQALDILETGNYGAFRTYDGIVALIYPIIPLLLILEFILGLIYKKPHAKVYKVNFLIYLFNRIIGRFLAIAMVTYIIGLLQPHAPYADIIRTTVCIALGVHPELLFIIMFIDGTWGAFIHIGENILKDGRLGFMNRIILTPSHHRVHHAKNPLYMDTNFCNLLAIWDRVFGTYQTEQHQIPIEYGITRDLDSGNFLDVYFGEIVALAKDMKAAPGFINKLKYLFMPPGWHHTGNNKTAKIVREEFIKSTTQPIN